MRDKAGNVIYVGKSRKLKNRVSQYFHDGAKNIKTAKMVSCVHDFDYILCDNEIEALTLENSLIKQHSPKYNIKLKDAKSYPYIKVSVADEYPNLFMSRSRSNDGAKYFGPYSSTATVYDVIGTIKKTLGLPSCKHKFPRDIGKVRPCIYSQIGRCMAPCKGDLPREEYSAAINCALDVLTGDITEACESLEKKMFAYADEEKFEAAARCRDTIFSLKKLRDKQKVVTDPKTEHDVIALYRDDVCSVISIFYVRGGAITDREQFNFGAGEILEPENISTFIGQFYSKREYLPKEILVQFEIPQEEKEDLEKYLSGIAGHRVYIKHPERGELRALCSMAYDNAEQNAKNFKKDSENTNESLVTLANLLQLEVYPERIEAYDISNIGREHKVAGMVVMLNGKFAKSDYRTFKIKSVEGQDDYASMKEALSRRIARAMDYSKEDSSFPPPPDLILLDGGKGHVSTIKALMDELGCDIPVFGMVKDEFHKTRMLTDGERDISIAKNQSVFMMIYKLQEEVHRFTYSKMDSAKRKTLRTSSLEKIKGIGEKKAKLLLAALGSVTAVKNADIETIAKVKGISRTDAENIYNYFAESSKRKEEDAK